MQKQNFLRDQSGMKKQLSTLQQLLQVMDPELYRHFEKTEGLNLFFCFRLVFFFLLCVAFVDKVLGQLDPHCVQA
jgi:Rab-GTPase-TBC domain